MNMNNSPIPDFVLQARGRTITFPRRPLIMGILNINDDSFSGDGRIDPQWALCRAAEMTAQGADIIDVGAESARTNRPPISEEEEIARLLPFLEGFDSAMRESAPIDDVQIFPPLLSINTWRPRVAELALGTGGHILNDIGGLPTPHNAKICARHGAALVIMHNVGEPKIPHTHVTYPDVLESLQTFFEEKIPLAQAAGLPENQIILDPGIDFAKQRDDNLRIYSHLQSLSKFRRPLLLPVSRKTVIGEVLGIPDPADRDAGTVACIVASALRGAHIVRVHNIPAAIHTLRLCTLLT